MAGVKFAYVGKLRCIFLLPIMSILSLILFKGNAFKGYDGTTLAYTIDTLLLVYAIRKYNLTNPVGIAKDMIIDEFVDAVLVVSANNTVQYSNPLAQTLFDIDANASKFQLSSESISILNDTNFCPYNHFITSSTISMDIQLTFAHITIHSRRLNQNHRLSRWFVHAL